MAETQESKRSANRFAAGDRVALDTPAGDRLRSGTVEEVVEGDHALHGYRIRWDDGHVALFSPSGRGLRRLDESAGSE